MSAKLFVGTWRLVSAEMQSPAGGVSQIFGENPSGYLIYSADGYMSAVVMHDKRANFASPDAMQGSLAEKAAAFDTFGAYCGRYEVKPDRIVHHSELSQFPNWSGTDQERFFEFSGDRLILSSAPMMLAGEERTARLVWQRCGTAI